MFSRRVWLVLGLVLACIGLIVVVLAFDIVPSPLQAPRVVAIEPANGATDVVPDSPITVTFSVAMDRAATESAVSFTPNITGNFIWGNDQTLVFTPDAGLPISTTVTANISSDARSWLQRPLQNQDTAQFTTLARPFVTESSPALDAQFIYVPSQMSITFNRAMDSNTLFETIKIDPPLENPSFDVSNNTFTIRGRFEPHTHYQFTIPADAYDADYGIALNRDYVWSFTTGLEYPNASIVNRTRVLKFDSNQPMVIPMQFTNVSRLDFAIYSIPSETLNQMADAPFETWYAFHPASDPIRISSVATNAQLDQYVQKSITLDPLPAGAYYLKLTTPEGVEDAQMLLVGN